LLIETDAKASGKDIDKRMENLIQRDRITGSVFLLRDLIQERLGLFFDDHNDVQMLTSKFAGRMDQVKCESFLDYYHLLMSEGPAAKAEWRYVIESLTKRKSGFWRHALCTRQLSESVLPQLLTGSHQRPLRIWSASCSTGEEPISIAMAVNEAGLFDRADIEIFASDACDDVIETAKQGVYSEQRVQHLDAHLRNKYFVQDRDGLRVVPALHQRIHWTVAHLMNRDEVAELARSNVIFCRNVFIYFSAHAICKTLHLFAEFMPAGAYLFSDAGEFFTTLISSSRLFEPLNLGGSDVWIRQDVR